MVTEADASNLVAFRERLKAEKAEEYGFAPGYNELLGIIVARTLRAFPYMNARLSADGSQIESLDEVNPVSYTHLDVYKRQASRQTGCLSAH